MSLRDQLSGMFGAESADRIMDLLKRTPVWRLLTDLGWATDMRDGTLRAWRL